MKSAEAFDRYDQTRQEAGGRLGNGIATMEVSTILIPQLDSRTAVPACVWLGMESAVRGIIELGLACRAHGENRHRGGRAVVGNVAHDGEAWATISAVYEGIAMAAIAGIEKFAEAVVTNANIRRDQGSGCRLSLAGNNAEFGITGAGDLSNHEASDVSKWRGFDRQTVDEVIHGFRRTFHLNRDARGCVADCAL